MRCRTAVAQEISYERLDNARQIRICHPPQASVARVAGAHCHRNPYSSSHHRNKCTVTEFPEPRIDELSALLPDLRRVEWPVTGSPGRAGHHGRPAPSIPVRRGQQIRCVMLERMLCRSASTPFHSRHCRLHAIRAFHFASKARACSSWSTPQVAPTHALDSHLQHKRRSTMDQ